MSIYHMDSSAIMMDSSAIMMDNSSETNDQKAQQPLLTDTVIENENIALNVMVSFMYLAQKRGAFNLKESSKIWECVKLFIKE